MKNIMKVLLVVMALVLVITAFTACEPEQPEVPEVPEDPTPEVCKHENVEFVLGKEPTCTEDGLTSGFKCKDCGEWTVAQEVDPAGHDYVIDVEVEPTCTEPGYTEKKCSRCDATTDHKVVEALGHDMKAFDEVPATCTKAGKEAGEKCTVCGHTTGGAVIPAGHKTGADGVCTECGYIVVSTYEELISALAKENAKVLMNNDIEASATQGSGYGVAGIVLNAGVLLDGNGHKLTINGANSTWDCAIAMRGGEVRNLTIAGAMRGVFMPGANGDVVIDNCVFVDVIYTFNSDAGSKEYAVTIKNTALNGWTSFSNVHKSVTFENCTFGEGSGYAFCRPYQATTFTGCTFAEGFGMDAMQTDAIVLTNCKLADADLTIANVATLIGEEAGVTATVNGEKYHVHKYAKETVAPTCTEAGHTTYACPCGDTYTEDVEALGHDYVGGDCTRCNSIITYVINSSKWEKVSAHMWNDGGATTEWPGVEMTKTEDTVNGFDIYSIETTSPYNMIIFNNSNNGSQTGNLTLQKGQYYYVKDSKWYASLDAVPELDNLSTGLFIAGEMNSWSTVANEFKFAKEGDTVATIEFTLAVGTYEFKVVNNGSWLGTGATISATNNSFDVPTINGDNMKINVTTAGTYVFQYDTTAGKITVVYP